jgi:hypothetical protein
MSAGTLMTPEQHRRQAELLLRQVNGAAVASLARHHEYLADIIEHREADEPTMLVWPRSRGGPQ